MSVFSGLVRFSPSGGFMKTILLAILLLTATAAATLEAATIVVNTTLDNNQAFPPPPYPLCSLRDAIMAANLNVAVKGCAKGDPGLDLILFNIGIGTPTIRPRTMLPVITEPVMIRGDSYGATRVEIDGSDASRYNFLGQVVHGLYLIGGDSTIRNLVINRFSGNGIVFADYSSGVLPDPTAPKLPENDVTESGGVMDPDIPDLGGAGSNNKVFGSFIGTDATGTIAMGNGSGGNTAGIMAATGTNTIGGTSASDRNVISGNRGHGIILAARGNWVRGNFIGLDVSGTRALGNQFDGIHIVGGGTSLSTGVIGANLNSGDPRCGMILDPESHRVLDDRRQCGNRIAFNTGSGIFAGYNAYWALSNSIFSNGMLGIDIDELGVSPNQANRNRNFPLLTWWRREFTTQGGVGTRVFGSITNSPSQEVVIQYFHSATCDPSNHGEGSVYYGSFRLSGNGSFAFYVPVTGGYVTAVSNTRGGRTSEFSACLAI
jgi:hypothetical protein